MSVFLGKLMKVVVFAHTPPPHHGQSYMVELMLQGFADPTRGIECFHVNAHLSKGMDDIGKLQLLKPFRLLFYCAHALWLRFRYGADALYYVPAPSVRSTILRDWIVLNLCRPFFRRVILHWHAAGLGEWISKQSGWARLLTHRGLDGADLSISIAPYNEADAAVFKPKRSVIIPYGIPDPCPNFSEHLQAWRARLQQRLAAAAALSDRGERLSPLPVRVLYLGICAEPKGLLDAVRAICEANRLCRLRALPFEFHLAVAGQFMDATHENRFRETLADLDNPATIRHVGFADAEAKARLFAVTDIFCFPTWYYAESFGLVVIEAMSFGMPIVATKWRAVPDFFPPDYPGLVEIKSPAQIAEALILLATRDDAAAFRERFRQNYSLEEFLKKLAHAFLQTR